MIFLLHIVSAVDSAALGKIDKLSFSQETLMDLFLKALTSKDEIYGSFGTTNNISSLAGVTSNVSGDIVSIRWRDKKLRGSLALQWLPDSLRKVIISNGSSSSENLEGTIDLISLPEELRTLNLSWNRLSGQISLVTLPERMVKLDLSINLLCGTLDLHSLPKEMQYIDLYENQFGGETDFSDLPKSLEYFNVSNNQELEGTLFMKSHVRLFYEIYADNSKVKLVVVGAEGFE